MVLICKKCKRIYQDMSGRHTMHPAVCPACEVKEKREKGIEDVSPNRGRSLRSLGWPVKSRRRRKPASARLTDARGIERAYLDDNRYEQLRIWMFSDSGRRWLDQATKQKTSNPRAFGPAILQFFGHGISDDDLNAFYATRIMGKSRSEASAELGISQHHVRARTERAVNRIRRNISIAREKARLGPEMRVILSKIDEICSPEGPTSRATKREDGSWA